jgi:hypothetical protein
MIKLIVNQLVKSLFSLYICNVIKKLGIITLLIFAYTIVLAHSIIPHHHHDENNIMHQADHHQDDDHDGGNGPDDSGLAHDFANYIHSGTEGDVYQVPDVKTSCDALTMVCVFTLFEFNIHIVEIPSTPLGSHGDYVPIAHQCLSSTGFRAPPASALA